MIRVAFLLGNLDQGWLGGVNYYRSLIYALNSLEDRQIHPVVITGKNPSASLVEALGDVEILHTSLLDPYSPKWLISKSIRTLFGKDPMLEKFLLRNEIKVVSHAPYIGRNKKVLTVGWIPDFQYRYLPHFFSKKEAKLRDGNNAKICYNSDAIIASSFSARKDLLEFAPYLDSSKALVMNFTSGIRPREVLPNIKELEKKYHFKSKYFLLPNQFWMHKNHRVVVDALKYLNDHEQYVQILFTGNSEDPRNKGYFYELLTYIESIGVSKNIIFLGITPYEDLMGLMENSIGLINPSFFEGWSSSVEEAKALGKKLILSDIPVHKEQAKVRVTFFAPNEYVALAEILISEWNSFDPDLDNSYVTKAKLNANERWKAYGKHFQTLIENLVKENA